MVLLKSKKQDLKKDTGFIGASMPRETVSFLSLFCLATGVTKTSILQRLLYRWTKQQKENYSEKELIKRVVNRALDAWIVFPKKNANFATFKNCLEIEFKNRGIDKHVIDIILKDLVYEKNKT